MAWFTDEGEWLDGYAREDVYEEYLKE